MQTNQDRQRTSKREPLIDAAELAAHYGVHRDTVYRWARTGRIPVHPAGTHRIRFDLDAVIKALGRSRKAA